MVPPPPLSDTSSDDWEAPALPCPLPWKPVLGVECTLVTTLEAAKAAVTWMRSFDQVAMDTGGRQPCMHPLADLLVCHTAGAAPCALLLLAGAVPAALAIMLPHTPAHPLAGAEGTLARGGSLDVVQLFADRRAFIFDLHSERKPAVCDVCDPWRFMLRSGTAGRRDLSCCPLSFLLCRHAARGAH